MAKVRQAVIQDIEAIVKLGYEAHKESPVYRDHAVSESKFRRTLAMMISSKRHYASVVIRDGLLDGVLLGVVAELPFSTKKQASDWLFYLRPAARGYAPGMIGAFLSWAWQQRGVVLVGMSNSAGVHIEKTENLYSKMGMSRVGGIWLDRYLETKAPGAIRG